jgi:hypothetical protein
MVGPPSNKMLAKYLIGGEFDPSRENRLRK